MSLSHRQMVLNLQPSLAAIQAAIDASQAKLFVLLLHRGKVHDLRWLSAREALIMAHLRLWQVIVLETKLPRVD